MIFKINCFAGVDLTVKMRSNAKNVPAPEPMTTSLLHPVGHHFSHSTNIKGQNIAAKTIKTGTDNICNYILFSSLSGQIGGTHARSA